jgi:hypothetical protein
MTLAAIITFLGLIAGVVVLCQIAEQRTFSSLPPEGHANSGGSKSDMTRAKRPNPY